MHIHKVHVPFLNLGKLSNLPLSFSSLFPCVPRPPSSVEFMNLLTSAGDLQSCQIMAPREITVKLNAVIKLYMYL